MKQRSTENKKSFVPEMAANESPQAADDEAQLIVDPLDVINQKRLLRVKQKEERRLVRLQNSDCSDDSFHVPDDENKHLETD